MPNQTNQTISTYEYALTLLGQIADQNLPAVPSMPFDAWARLWLQVYRKGLVKNNTYENCYREPVELHLIPYFGDTPLTAIKPLDVQRFFASLRDQYALETLKKIKAALRSLYADAMDNGLCSRSPVTRSLRITSDVPPKRKRVWTQQEYDLAWEYAKRHPYGLGIMVLMETAITRSELLGLTWLDHDVRSCCLHICDGLVEQRDPDTGNYELSHGGLKNQHRRRTLPISKALNACLVLQRNRKDRAHSVPTQYIFASPQGKPWSPSNWSKRVCQQFMRDLLTEHPEITPLTAHELRHTRATLLKDQGVDIYHIARLLGHSDLKMCARRYVHDNPETLRHILGYDGHTDAANS